MEKWESKLICVTRRVILFVLHLKGHDPLTFAVPLIAFTV